ncbi:hypothetical protein, partial [Aquidulcibacter sp.]|uniref:hypothetical protein n=1 Tax=Aquidulcibacter sp. TaxID=2052990 RepID=UPI0026119C9C
MDKTKSISLRMGNGWDRAARAAHRYAAAGAAIAARSFGGHRRMRQRCRSPLSYWERGASGGCGWKKDAFIWTRFGAQSGHPTALNVVAGQSRLAFGAGRACTKAFQMKTPLQAGTKQNLSHTQITPAILVSFATKRPYRFSGGSG